MTECVRKQWKGRRRAASASQQTVPTHMAAGPLFFLRKNPNRPAESTATHVVSSRARTEGSYINDPAVYRKQQRERNDQ